MKTRLAIVLALTAVVWFAVNRYELRNIERDMAKVSGLRVSLRTTNPFSLRHLALSTESMAYGVPGEAEMKAIMDRVPSHCGYFDIEARGIVLMSVDMNRFRRHENSRDIVIRMIESADLHEKNGSYSERCFAAYELFEEIMHNWGTEDDG